ncbi:LysR substrate-binding domain-containing protein [Rhodanobacter aciditrophus]|uniref:LysR substrate-binding domain-containing protein n=1 Tax=Rhodanobacter aciditrophus TaxID=1623218 RepID=A0ABW4AZZ8_9GAMM
MHDLPISLLRTFMVVADTLNLTEAGRQLHKAPSTVSMQLNRLEDLVANPLMERGQYGVRLTAAGNQLKGHAQQLLNLHDQIVGTFQNMDINGVVRIGTHDQYASGILAPILQEFILSYPEAELEAFCDYRPDQLIDRLDRGKLDLALVEMTADSQGGTRLRRDQLIWVSAKDHFVHTQEVLPLIVFEEGCLQRKLACAALEAKGIPYRIAFTSQSRTGVLAAVRAGIGVAILPDNTLDQGEDLVVHWDLPKLPEMEVTLFSASKTNEATKRLEGIILDSPIFQSGV